MAHAETTQHSSAPIGDDGDFEGQQHPLGIYFKIWAMLFVLSTLSYLVDYFDFQSYLRWTLILTFMVMKAGLIVSVFMHMAWERFALVYAVMLPPLAILVFTSLMMFEGDYTEITRLIFFGEAPEFVVHHP